MHFCKSVIGPNQGKRQMNKNESIRKKTDGRQLFREPNKVQVKEVFFLSKPLFFIISFLTFVLSLGTSNMSGRNGMGDHVKNELGLNKT